MRLTLSAPDITELEIAYVDQVLRTPNLSMGPMTEQFETGVANYVGTRYAIGVSSGTAGLHTCIIGAGVTDRDRVLTTPFSFVASANCILYERAIPVFVDIDPDTLNIDPHKAESMFPHSRHLTNQQLKEWQNRLTTRFEEKLTWHNRVLKEIR